MEYFAWMVVSMILSYAISMSMAPRVQNPKPAALEEFEFPQYEEGAPQCVIFGDCWIEDWMVLGTTNFYAHAIRTKGGKK